MSKPLFSVVVPTFGRRHLLGQAVGSVLRQTQGDLEVIVVDDAGPETVRIPDDPRVRLIKRAENGGPAAARNSGLREARGRYVAFCDDDDLMLPDRLESALDGLARAPVALCFNRYLDGRLGRTSKLEGDVRDTVLNDMAPHVGRTAVELELVPEFDERFDSAEDIEWWLRLSKAAKVTTVPRVGYLVRRHPGVRGRTGLEPRIRSRLMLLDLYSDYFDAHPKAKAFAWKRIGLMRAALGDHASARRAYLRSMASDPKARTVWHIARSARPSRLSLG